MFLESTSGSNHFTYLVTKGDATICTYTLPSSGFTLYFRKATLLNSGVEFGGGAKAGAGYSDQYCIPTKIFGIK